MSTPEKNQSILTWLLQYFPALSATLPAELKRFHLQDCGIEGVCNHTAEIREEWFYSGDLFAEDNQLPEFFYAAAVEEQLNSEYLIVAWKKNDAVFWFRDQYLSVFGQPGSCSKAKTNTKLVEALKTHQMNVNKSRKEAK